MYDYTLEELRQFTICGQPIPTLEEVLELTCKHNEEYRAKKGRNLTLNLELKGEGTVFPVYSTIKPYFDSGCLDKTDFVFNTFKWKRLEQIKQLDPELQIVPNVKTADLFGAENMQMPGYRVKPTVTYQPQGLKKLADFHQQVGCHAFDCVIQDIRPPLFELAKELNIGVYASPASGRLTNTSLGSLVQQFADLSTGLPSAYIKADNVATVLHLVAASDRVAPSENGTTGIKH